jgi:hypothetical protein
LAEGGFLLQIKIEIEDEEVKKKLEEERNLNEVEVKQTVSSSELFNQSFMFKYTKYVSFNLMLDESGLLEKYGDFESIHDKEWDIFIQKNTKFSSWEEMKSKAANIWISKQIRV